MAALERIRIWWDNPPGGFRVEYEDTLRPNRKVIEEFSEGDSVSVGEAARITGIPRRTLYNWIEAKILKTDDSDPDHYFIPISEIRRLLKEQENEDEDDDDDEWEEDEDEEDWEED